MIYVCHEARECKRRMKGRQSDSETKADTWARKHEGVITRRGEMPEEGRVKGKKVGEGGKKRARVETGDNRDSAASPSCLCLPWQGQVEADSRTFTECQLNKEGTEGWKWAGRRAEQKEEGDLRLNASPSDGCQAFCCLPAPSCSTMWSISCADQADYTSLFIHSSSTRRVMITGYGRVHSEFRMHSELRESRALVCWLSSSRCHALVSCRERLVLTRATLWSCLNQSRLWLIQALAAVCEEGMTKRQISDSPGVKKSSLLLLVESGTFSKSLNKAELLDF